MSTTSIASCEFLDIFLSPLQPAHLCPRLQPVGFRLVFLFSARFSAASRSWLQPLCFHIVNEMLEHDTGNRQPPTANRQLNHASLRSHHPARSRRRFLLHHGTILCDFDIARVARYLKHPPREPAYRGRRPHEQFLVNLPPTLSETAAALHDAFGPFAATLECDGFSPPSPGAA